MQYRVIICDDEAYIASSTAMLLQLQVQRELDVHVFNAPADALACIQHAKVDLLILDICMPGMDGIELMKRARGLWPACQIILLTAHSHFDYVFEANRHENVSYVLKREGHGVLLAEVEKAFDRLGAVTEREKLLRAAKQRVDSSLPYLQRELLLDLVHGISYAPEALARLQRELSLSVDLAQPFSLYLLLLQDYPKDEMFLKREERMGMLLSMDAPYRPDGVNVLSATLDGQRLLCLAQRAGGGAVAPVQLEGMLENMQQAVYAQLGIPLSCVYTPELRDWRDLSAQYERASLLQASMAMGGGAMWLLPSDAAPESTERMDVRYAARARGWRHAFENGDPQADALLSALLAPLRAARSLTDLPAMEMYANLSLQVGAALRAAQLSGDADLLMRRLYDARTHADPQAAAAFIEGLVARIRSGRRDDAHTTMCSTVERVCDYVKAHLGDDVSLSRLADHAGVNASYLSRLFKKATGENLIVYISEQKMAYARRELEKPDVRIQDISHALGFFSPAYFSFFFKKNAGLTPSEFREGRLREKS